jgi:glycine cleavage system H protein
MNVPDDRLYTKDHEWIRAEGTTATVGITDYAQTALGDVTFVDPAPVGDTVAKGTELGAVESCKAAASVYAPAAGTVLEANTALEDDPGLVNREPYGAGWLCKITLSDPAELDGLLKPDAYRQLCEKAGE